MATTKPAMELIPPGVLLALGDILAWGSGKYAPNDWVNHERPVSVHYAALLRHLCYWYSGETHDPESGLPHTWHALARLVMIVQLTDPSCTNDWLARETPDNPRHPG